MTDFPSYTLGTVSVSNGATTVVGDGTIWTGVNARAGDTIVIGTSSAVIVDVTDDNNLKIDAWPFTTVTAGTSYKIVQNSPLRFVGGQAMADVSSLIAVLRSNGLLWYLPEGYTDPNDIVPALTADDGQGVLRIDTGALWVMSGGTWVPAGTYKGFNYKGAYNPATAYVANDVLTSGGSAYLVTVSTTGNAPPNASYYDVFASKGDTGTITVGTVTTGAGGSSAAVTNVGTSTAAILDFTIPAGKTYSGTSTTSLAIGTGSKAFTTQSGLAYTNGARVRASSAANTTNWMEGLVTYSGTTLTMTSDKSNGSGTHTDWNLNVVGEPGAGDLSSTNNLSDLANADTALTNLGGTTVGKAIFTAADAAAARSIIGSGTITPQGRLTVTSGVAFPTSSVAAATTIYYTPANGNLVPLFNGTDFIATGLAELSIALGSNWAALSCYDVFIADDGGTIRLATGPGWTTFAVPGNRGTGAGTTELVAVQGILLNANSMTLRYNNTTTFSVSAQRATYVGTIGIPAGAGTVNWIYGALAAGGTAADFGIWNAYNRMPVYTQVSSSTDSWTYNVVAWRAPNGSSTYRASAVRGLNVDGVIAHYTALAAPGAATNATCGIGVNSTTVNSGVNQSINSGNGPINARYAGLIGLGYAYVTPLEHNSTTTASSWYGDAATAFLQTGFSAEFWQ